MFCLNLSCHPSPAVRGTQLDFPFPLCKAILIPSAGDCVRFGYAGFLAWPQNASSSQAMAQEAPQTFTSTCTLCHGSVARGTDRAPSLVDSAKLRSMADSGISEIIRNGKEKMPPFPLPSAEIDALTRYVRSLSPIGSASAVAGDAKAGERVFFGSGQCSTCHMIRGHGAVNGPDLSDVGRRLRLEELKLSTQRTGCKNRRWLGQSYSDAEGWRKLQGFARALGSHDLVLQTNDARLHLLLDSEYRDLSLDKRSAMQAFKGSDEEQGNLVAFMSSLKGAETGPATAPQTPASVAEIDEIAHPKAGDWPTYNGRLDGNRHSNLYQVNTQNVPRIQLQWTFSIPFNGLETTPLVIDGVMYATGNNQVYALSGKTGREIWRYERPKSAGASIASDAAIGVNRGVAMLGDRIFYLTDDAHLIALHRLTGALLWDVNTHEGLKGLYGGTSAHLLWVIWSSPA